MLVLGILAKYCAHQDKLSFAPKGMDISSIVYVAEESSGFGPGGNETGIIVYELPENTANAIQNKGIAYLNGMHVQPHAPKDWHGHYEQWFPTPMLLEGSENTNEIKSFEIGKYLDRYGFGIPIDPKIEREINQEISTPGSFIAYGRIGICIVSPGARKVVYAYHG